jgi:hypothetical protein
VGGQEISLSPQNPIQLWGPPSILYNGKRRFFPWGKADQSHPCSTEVKNVQSYTSTAPYIFMMWYLIEHKNNFTLKVKS